MWALFTGLFTLIQQQEELEMEISNNVPKTGVAQTANQRQGVADAKAVEGQKLPAFEAKIPVLESKAAPAVPEFKAKDIAKAIENLQSYVDKLGRNLNFSRDDSINCTIISVRDARTSELVRQIPVEEVVAISRHLETILDERQAAGLLYDDKI